MSDYLEQLNEVQRQAVTTIDGPVMVIAGPGSGKTRVLTYRVAHLINTGIPPWSILALTFTNKAAREMKERIERVTSKSTNDIWAGTFHSIFARILRVEAEAIGFPSNFTIYDTDDSRSLINELVKELKLDKSNYNPAGVHSRISSAKSNLITPKLYAKDVDLMEQDRMSRRPKLHEIYARYVKRCKLAGAMDFDDLLLKLFELFQKNPEALTKYRERFKYVLVDEFQDTNYLQYAIVKQLCRYPESHENICIVGDDAQSIYSFRGATIANILEFERDFKEVQVFKLEQNYRSTDHIVAAANQIIANNRKQIQKKIWTESGEGAKIKLIKAVSDAEEGRQVSDLILEQKNRHHLSNSEVAILYRTNAQSRVFEEHLRRANIPYRIYGGLSFYQRKEVKDLLAYLRLAVNPRDNEAFKRSVNHPKRGIGATTVQKVLDHATENELCAIDAIDEVPLPARAKNLLTEYKKLIRAFVRKAETEDAFTTAMYIFLHSGLQKMLKADNTMEGVNRYQNVAALLDGIKEFTEEDQVEENSSTDRSLAAYIQNIALLTDFDTQDDDTDFVTLMSVHSAKGLEFKSVFVVGMEENLFPSYMSMSTPDQLDEERRLFYVAITRAERYLTLSYANSRYQYGQIRYNDPSRFIDEVPEENYEDTGGRRDSIGMRSPSGGTSGIGGVPLRKIKLPAPVKVPLDFKPSPSHLIIPGVRVLHLKFGKGTVARIEGGDHNKVATIKFESIDNPERKIMLRFAKLQILD